MGRGPAERRYALVQVRTWSDEKVRSLSAPQPNAQTLFFRLLTGPETSRVPGVILAGRAALAEALGWDLSDFDRCWRELEETGLAVADWAARVIYLPGAFRQVCNLPTSPSTAACWRKELLNAPECDLTRRVDTDLRAMLATMGAAYLGSYMSGKRADTTSQTATQAAHQTAPQTATQTARQSVPHLAPAPAPAPALDPDPEIAPADADAAPVRGDPEKPRKAPKATPEPLPYTIAAFVAALEASPAAPQLALDPVPSRLHPPLGRLIRKYPIADVQLVAAWLPADWRLAKGETLTMGQAVASFDGWIGLARKWHEGGRRTDAPSTAPKRGGLRPPDPPKPAYHDEAKFSFPEACNPPEDIAEGLRKLRDGEFPTAPTKGA